MSEIPLIPYKEIGPYIGHPLGLADICREKTQEFFDIIRSGGPQAPPENLLKDDQRDERFDSATMTFFREIIVEWSADDILMRVEAKSDGMYHYNDEYTFKLSLRSSSAEFETFCDAMVKTVCYKGDKPSYYLDLQKSQVTAKGLNADQLEKLAKLLLLPPELAKAQAVPQ